MTEKIVICKNNIAIHFKHYVVQTFTEHSYIYFNLRSVCVCIYLSVCMTLVFSDPTDQPTQVRYQMRTLFREGRDYILFGLIIT